MYDGRIAQGFKTDVGVAHSNITHDDTHPTI